MINPVAMQVKIRVRSGTSEEWAAKDPVLLLAEPGYDSTARVLKIGDGSSTWTQLPETNVVDDAPSPTGHAVIKAADPAAARAAIGAAPAADLSGLTTRVEALEESAVPPVTVTDHGAYLTLTVEDGSIVTDHGTYLTLTIGA